MTTLVTDEEETVLSALKAAINNGHPEIVILKQFIPWKKEIHEAEKEINVKTMVKYIIFLVGVDGEFKLYLYIQHLMKKINKLHIKCR